LLLQPYSVDGTALAAAQVVDSQSSGQIGSQRLAALNGQVLMTWVKSNVVSAIHRYALVRGVGASADVHTLAIGATPGGYVENGRVVVPVLGSGIAALQWSGPLFSYTTPGPLPETSPRAVTLDAFLNPVRSTAGNLDNELLPTGWSGASQPFLVGAVGDRFVAASFGPQRQTPEVFGPGDFVLTSFVQPGAAPLATAAMTAPTLTNASGTLTNINRFGRPTLLLLSADRALVIGDDSNRTMVSLFWLR
jgi:hypothetical protein